MKGAGSCPELVALLPESGGSEGEGAEYRGDPSASGELSGRAGVTGQRWGWHSSSSPPERGGISPEQAGGPGMELGWVSCRGSQRQACCPSRGGGLDLSPRVEKSTWSPEQPRLWVQGWGSPGTCGPRGGHSWVRTEDAPTADPHFLARVQRGRLLRDRDPRAQQLGRLLGPQAGQCLGAGPPSRSWGSAGSAAEPAAAGEAGRRGG